MDMAAEPRWRVEPAGVDIHRSDFDTLPGRSRGAGKDPPSPIQELDVPVRALDLCHLEYCYCVGARMAQLQPEIHCGGLRQLLHRAAHYVDNVYWVEVVEEDEDCASRRDGPRDRCLSDDRGGHKGAREREECKGPGEERIEMDILDSFGATFLLQVKIPFTESYFVSHLIQEIVLHNVAMRPS